MKTEIAKQLEKEVRAEKSAARKKDRRAISSDRKAFEKSETVEDYKRKK